MFINWFEQLDEMQSACPKILTLAEAVMNRPRILPVHLYNFGEGLGWRDA